MSFRASHLKSILDNLGQEEYNRVVNAARFNDQTQLGQLVNEMDPRDFDFAIHFVNKIKERFNNNLGIYKQFLDILSTYRRDKRTIVVIYNKVKELFASQPDLFEEFQKFLPDPTATPSPPSEHQDMHSTTSFVSPEEIAFFERVKVVVGSKESYDAFLKLINLYNQDIINKQILVERVAFFLSKSPDLFSWFRNYIQFKPQDNAHLIVNQFKSAGIALNHPFSSKQIKQHFSKDMLNLGNKDVQLWQVNGSYRLMPSTELKAPSSGRDPLANSVLNHVWVSHPTWASEDEGFSVHRKNIFEETLHRTEDEKFEMDMKILTNEVGINVLTKLQANVKPEEPLNIKEVPTTLYKKAIRQIYQERGEEMINAVLKNPAVAFPVVLYKLKQYQVEWAKDRRELDRVWRDIFKTNFWKALDAQTAIYKQLDKKLFSQRHLQLETTQLMQHKQRLQQLDSIPSPKPDVQYALAGTETVFALDDKTTPIRALLEPGTRFINNDAFMALKCFMEVAQRLEALKSIKSPKQHLNPTAVKFNYPCVPSDQEYIENPFEFILLHLKAFINQSEDMNQFETNCRKAYGLNGYKLTTLDSVFTTLFKLANEMIIYESVEAGWEKEDFIWKLVIAEDLKVQLMIKEHIEIPEDFKLDDVLKEPEILTEQQLFIDIEDKKYQLTLHQEVDLELITSIAQESNTMDVFDEKMEAYMRDAMEGYDGESWYSVVEVNE